MTQAREPGWMRLFESDRVAALAWLGVLVLSLLCYWPGLSGPPLLDDEIQVLPLVRSLDTGNWPQRALLSMHSASGPGGRPVAMLSLIASAVAHGPDLHAFKYENLLLHLVCANLLLGWCLSLRRGLELRGRSTSFGAWPAILAAGFWVLHPLLVSTVLYTVQRMSVLSTLFVFAGLWAYSAARNADLAAVPARRRAVGLYALCFLLCLPLAALSKENGVLLVPMCALVECYVYNGAGTRSQQRALRALFGVLLVLPCVLAITVFAAPIMASLSAGFSQRNFTMLERLLTEGRVWCYYLWEWALPTSRNLSFFHDDLVVSTGPWSPWTTLPAFAILSALLLLALKLRRAQPLIGLGVCLFLLGHLLEGSVVPLELMFEHRNYLPGAGLALALSALPVPRQVARYVLVCAACGLLLVLSARTFTRAGVWSSNWSLFQALYEANPDSPRLSAYFANNYINGGNFDLARKVLERQNSAGAMLQRLDVACMARSGVEPARLADGIAALQGVMTAYEVSEIVHLVNDALTEQCGIPLSWARDLVDRALTLPTFVAPSRQLLLFYRGHIDHAQGRHALALQDLQEASAADPGNPLPLLLAAEWSLDEHARAQASRLLDQARAIPGAVGGEYQATIELLDHRIARGDP